MSEFPANDGDLRQLVATMRELGVLQAFGVVLGPPPMPAEPERDPKITAELRQRADMRQRVRDMLAHAGADNWPDEQLDAYAADLGFS